ncbi:hypothetical protein FQZ97_1254220 [compost metagenome]
MGRAGGMGCIGGIAGTGVTNSRITPPPSTDPLTVPSPRTMRSQRALFSGGSSVQRFRAFCMRDSGVSLIVGLRFLFWARTAAASRRQLVRSCCESLRMQAARSCS